MCCLSQCSLYRPKRRLAHGSSPASRSRLSVSQCSVVTRVYWCTFPSPATSFLAREKAFLRAFFCRSGTAIIPCLRSLCTYNFLKSVHFLPRLAVYHLKFTLKRAMFAVYLPFFAYFCAGTRKRPLVPAAKRRISFGGHTGPWLPGYGSGRGGQGQDSGGSCLGCRRERRRQLAQLPLECKDSAQAAAWVAARAARDGSG